MTTIENDDDEHFKCMEMVSCKVMTIDNEHLHCVRMVSFKGMTIENDNDRK